MRRGWCLALALLAGSAHAAEPPFVVAPVVEGLFSCGTPGATDISAGSYCAAHGGRPAAALRALLDDLEPGGPRGSVQVGYVMTIQLLGLYRAAGEGWELDPAKLQRVTELLREVDRPVVVYLAANHFDSQGPLPQALAKDKANLMLLANGTPPATDYFGYRVLPFTLVADPGLPVNAYRFAALRVLAERLARLPAPLQERLVGVALGGELHHLYPDFSAGMGVFEGARVTDYGEASVRSFRAWLATKYGSVARLNAQAGTGFASFDAVPAPGRNALIDPAAPLAQHYDGFAGGKLPVHGWLWDPDQRVQRLELRIDGNAAGPVARGFNRLDVYRAVEEISDPAIGFRHDFDFSAMKPGRHRLQVVAHSAGGEHVIGERIFVVEGAAPSRLTSLWNRLSARLRLLVRGSLQPLPGVRAALDSPRNEQRVLFNPLARDWNEFRAWQVHGFLGELHRIALRAGLPAHKLYSHQILARANSSWNADLFASDSSVADGVPWMQGINTYGGAAGGAWIREFVQARRMRDYGLPEFHPQQWKRPAAALEALQLHRHLGARFVSPYYVSMASDRQAMSKEAVKGLEIRPNNRQEGSDLLFQAIRELASQ